MGLCHGKPAQIPEADAEEEPRVASGAGDAAGGVAASPAPAAKPGTPKQPKFPFYLPSPLPASSYKGSPANSSVASTPARGGFKRPFPPPSPAKHIRALLARRHGSVKPNEASIPEGGEPELGLDKSFGFSKHFFAKYDLGEEVGRGHFGYTCAAKAKKGEHKGQDVAVKVIPKAKVRIRSILTLSIAMPGFIACVCFIAEISSAAYVQLHSLHFYQFFFMRDWISACPNNAFSAHVWIQSFATLDSSPVLYVLTTCISIMFFFWLIISDTLSSFCICASHIDFGTASLDSSHNLAESSPHFFSAPGALVIVGGRESDLALAGTAELAATLRYSWRWSLVELIYPDVDTPLCIH
jgi:hypothetical protein